MQKLILTVSLSLWAGAASAQKIERVVVFGDRAQVTRTQTVTCTGGVAQAQFFPLPISVIDRTVRAVAQGKAKAVGTVVSLQPLAADHDARRAKLTKTIEELQAKLRTQEAARGAIKARMGTLDGYGQYLRSVVNETARNAKPDTKAWFKALGLMRGEGLAARSRLADIEDIHQETVQDLGDSQRRLNRLGPSSDQGKVAVASIRCNGATKAKIQLTYVLPGATWRPEYDIRFKAAGQQRVGKGQLELTVSGVVQQSTGEDWADVELVLSSARPWLGVDVPLPNPIRVTGRKGGDKKVVVQGQERRVKLGDGVVTASSSAASAAIDDKGQSVTLRLPHAVTIYSDGRPYWMPIDHRKRSATSKLVAVPKLRPYVFQLVNFHNPAPYPLLAGRAHMYRNGTYIGDIHMPHRGPGEPIEASLGIDEQLTIERTTLRDAHRKPGTFSSTKRMERGYNFTLSSHVRESVVVELRENIPVSKVDEVKVRIGKKKTTKGFEHDRDRGLLSWPVTLEPGQSKQVRLFYTIKLPDDWAVQ